MQKDRCTSVTFASCGGEAQDAACCRPARSRSRRTRCGSVGCERTTPRSCEAGQPSFARRTPARAHRQPVHSSTSMPPRRRLRRSRHRVDVARLASPSSGKSAPTQSRQRPGVSRRSWPAPRSQRHPRRPSLQRRPRPAGTAAGRAPASNAYLPPSPTPLPSPARPAPPSPPDPPGPGARIMTRYEHHRRAGGNRRHRAPGPDRDRRGRSARDFLRHPHRDPRLRRGGGGRRRLGHQGDDHRRLVPDSRRGAPMRQAHRDDHPLLTDW